MAVLRLCSAELPWAMMIMAFSHCLDKNGRPISKQKVMMSMVCNHYFIRGM